MSYNQFKSVYNANFKIFAQSNLRQSVKHRLYKSEYALADLPEQLRLICPNNEGCFERTTEISDTMKEYEHIEWVFCESNQLIGKAFIINNEIEEITEIEKV